MTFVVYDIHRAGALIYVGMTSREKRRRQAHHSRGLMRDGDTFTVVSQHKTREAAMEAETGSTGKRKDGWRCCGSGQDRSEVQSCAEHD